MSYTCKKHEHKIGYIGYHESCLRNMVGKKIKLIHTDDPYTRRKSGDIGIIESIERVNLPHNNKDHFHQIWIKWFDTNEYGLALILESDKFEVLA